MKRFTLRLTEAEYSKLRNYCQEIHVSMNDVIRQMIREWQPKSQKPVKSGRDEDWQD